MRPHTHHRHPLTPAALAALACATGALADTHTWTGPHAGAWSNPAHWSPVGVPAPGDDAHVLHDAPGILSVGLDTPYSPDQPLNSLTLNASSQSLTLFQSADFHAANAYVATTGHATLVQSATTIASLANSLYLGHAAGSTGTYSLTATAASLSALATYVGNSGSGAFAHTAGSHALAGALYVGYGPGSAGTYALSGAGSLSAAVATYVGFFGTGSFSHTGGTHTTPALTLGFNPASDGSYSLSASASLTVDGTATVARQGATGTFLQTGGTVTVNGLLSVAGPAGSVGTFAATAGALTTRGINIGGSGLATLDFSGSAAVTSSGTVNIGTRSTFRLADSATFTVSGPLNSYHGSTMSLTGGTLKTGFQHITQLPGSAHVVHSAGTHAPTGLSVGYADGATGTYSLSSTARLAVGADDEFIGDRPGSVGTFAQTGGSHSVVNTLYVGNLGTGRYLHSAGTLSVSTNAVSVGQAPGAAGHYSLSGTARVISPMFYVGNRGTGTLTQTGGTLALSLALFVGGGTDGTGSYTLSAGSVLAPDAYVGGRAAGPLNAAGTFLIDGGSASFASTLRIYPLSTVTWSSGTLAAHTIDLRGGTLRLTPGNDKHLRATSLTLTRDSTLDLTDNPLTLDTADPNTAAATLRTYLSAGPLLSSAATPTHRLAYATTPTSALVRLTLTGDANLDGLLNSDDYALLDRGFATSGQFWWQGDFNYDGQVDEHDYLLIDTTYLSTKAQGWQSLGSSFLAKREAQFGSAYLQQLLTSIPEPTTPLACLFAGLLTRRHNRKTQTKTARQTQLL